MPPRHRYGVEFKILGVTDRGWELAVAFRKADGACWAVICDGLSEHVGPNRPDPDAAAEDALGLAGELEYMGDLAKQHRAAQAGVN